MIGGNIYVWERILFTRNSEILIPAEGPNTESHLWLICNIRVTLTLFTFRRDHVNNDCRTIVYKILIVSINNHDCKSLPDEGLSFFFSTTRVFESQEVSR